MLLAFNVSNRIKARTTALYCLRPSLVNHKPPDVPLSTHDIWLTALPGLRVIFTSTMTHVCAFSCTLVTSFEILTHSTDSRAVICAHHQFLHKGSQCWCFNCTASKVTLFERRANDISWRQMRVEGDRSVGKAFTTKHKDLTSTLSTHMEVWWVKMCSQSQDLGESSSSRPC